MFLRIGIRKTRNTWRLSFGSGTKLLFTFLSLSFPTWGERDTISYSADCSYIVSSQLTDSTNARASCRPNWSRVGELRKSTRFVQVQNSTSLSHRVISLFYVNLPPVASQFALKSTCRQPRLSPHIFDRKHQLFTQVHFPFWQLGQVGGQYVTVCTYGEKICSIWK